MSERVAARKRECVFSTAVGKDTAKDRKGRALVFARMTDLALQRGLAVKQFSFCLFISEEGAQPSVSIVHKLFADIIN